MIDEAFGAHLCVSPLCVCLCGHKKSEACVFSRASFIIPFMYLQLSVVPETSKITVTPSLFCHVLQPNKTREKKIND